MSADSNGQREHRVILVGSTKSDLRRFHQDRLEKGQGHLILDALRKISDRLTRRPHEFGEPLDRLPAMRCMVYQAIVIPLVVTYAIHDELPLVFVHVVKRLSDPVS